jgi:ribosome-binding protein aMBF1 (putative translation factor)
MENSNKKRPDETTAEWLKRVSIVDDSWLKKAKWRRANRYWLRKSQGIALQILSALDDKDITKEDLAKEMGMAYEEFKPILQGKVDLNLSTICKLQNILGVKLISTPHDNNINDEME